MTDNVNHPAHYGGEDNPYETIKVIEAWGLGFNLGNAVKYISRAEHKGAAVEDLRKAAWYLQREIERRHRAAKPKLAQGGPVRKGVPYIVGEARAKLFVPDEDPATCDHRYGFDGGSDEYRCVSCRQLAPIDARDEALRELLSYCRTQSDTQHTPEGAARLAYADVHQKLAKILDGER